MSNLVKVVVALVVVAVAVVVAVLCFRKPMLNGIGRVSCFVRRNLRAGVLRIKNLFVREDEEELRQAAVEAVSAMLEKD